MSLVRAPDVCYEPYPIGVARPVFFEAGIYRTLVKRYPPRDAFAYLPKVGHKYVLSEKFNAGADQPVDEVGWF